MGTQPSAVRVLSACCGSIFGAPLLGLDDPGQEQLPHVHHTCHQLVGGRVLYCEHLLRGVGHTVQWMMMQVVVARKASRRGAQVQQ
jgi:hypothetical protein